MADDFKAGLEPGRPVGPKPAPTPRSHMVGEPAATHPSRAALKGHPIHPMLIPFPITCLVLAFISDIVFLSTGTTIWAHASLWLIGIGVVTALVAAVFGAIDFAGIKAARDHSAGWIHAAGNVVVVLISLVNWMLRIDDPLAAAVPLGILLSGATALLLVVTGWYGGELSYRHRIGVMSGDGQPMKRRQPGEDPGGVSRPTSSSPSGPPGRGPDPLRA